VKFETFRIKFEKLRKSLKAVLMPESQPRSSSEDDSMLASLWPICSILSMSRKLECKKVKLDYIIVRFKA